MEFSQFNIFVMGCLEDSSMIPNNGMDDNQFLKCDKHRSRN